MVAQIEMEEEEEDGERIRAWQWRDDWGYWHLYTEQQTENLERAYKRKKDGSCVIQRGNKKSVYFCVFMMESLCVCVCVCVWGGACVCVCGPVCVVYMHACVCGCVCGGAFESYA